MPNQRGRGVGRGMPTGAVRGRGGPRFATLPQNRFAAASFPSPPMPS